MSERKNKVRGRANTAMPAKKKSLSSMALVAAIMAHGLAGKAGAQGTNSPATKPGQSNIRPAENTSTNATTKLPEVTVTGHQEGTSYKPESVTLPKFTEPLRDTPQSVTVVPQQLMSDQGATTLREGLRNVPGISIAAGEGGSQGDNLSIRGFSARNDIFLDGMRDFGSYYRDPFDFEQIEVFKGPSSTAFGRGTTGGVVNQATKTPTLNPSIGGTLAFGTDLTRRATVDLNEPVPEMGKGGAVRLNLMGNDSEVAGRDIAENRRFGVAPSLALGLGSDTRFTLSYYHQTEDNVPDYGVPWLFNKPAPVDRNNYYGFEDENHLKTEVDIVTLRLEHDISENVSLRDQFRYGHYYRDALITEARVTGAPTPATPLSAITVTRNQIAAVSTETILANQVDVISHFDTGPLEHTLISGGEVGRETSNPTRFAYTGVPGTSLLYPDESQPFAGTGAVTTDTQTTGTSVGVFALDTMKWGEHWELGGGASWQYFDVNYHQTAGAVKTALHRADHDPSWRGTLVYKPIRAGSIYFAYGTSFNPSAESLSLSATTANTDPEENQTFELGTKWDLFEERLSLTAAVYRTDKTNAREPDPNDPTQNVLAGGQRVDGFELAANGRLTKEWRVFAGYAYMDGRVVESQFYTVGTRLANVPKHSFNLWTTVELPWHFEIGGGINHVASRTASSTTPLDPTTGLVKEIPDYWTLNALVKYHVNKHIDIQANIYNLTDKYYYDQIHPGHVVPGAGLSALFTTNFRF